MGSSQISFSINPATCGGRDKISVRGLFEKQKEYLPEFKAFLICNKIPLLSENTFASWRRIRLIDFPVKFIENPDPDNSLEKLIDEDLEKKIDEWAPNFAGYLTHWLKTIYDEGGFKNIKEPEAVIRRTQEYKDENDHWREYINEYLLKNENCFLLFSDLKTSFKTWLNNNRKGDNPKISEIKDYFSKHLCKWIHTTDANNKTKEGYPGWSLKFLGN